MSDKSKQITVEEFQKMLDGAIKPLNDKIDTMEANLKDVVKKEEMKLFENRMEENLKDVVNKEIKSLKSKIHQLETDKETDRELAKLIAARNAGSSPTISIGDNGHRSAFSHDNPTKDQPSYI